MTCSRIWSPISIFLTRSIWPLEVGRVKNFGHREPNAMLGRRRGGTLEGSADGADGATGLLLTHLELCVDVIVSAAARRSKKWAAEARRGVGGQNIFF